MGFIMVNGISYGTGEPVHVTKEEYDALPDSKLTDGQLYLVEDEEKNPAANVVGLVDINEAINGVVLWENPNPSAEFPAQTVTLSDSIEKYEAIAVECVITGSTGMISSGKINKTTDLKWRTNIVYANDTIYLRDVYVENGNSFTISECYKRTQYGTFIFSPQNSYLIPIRLIAYPKADFNPIDGILPPAQNVSYDNTTSGLTAENVQDAVDEISLRNAFSFDEVRIGTWLDGKPLYRRMVDFGAFPNNGEKRIYAGQNNIAHGHINIGESYWVRNDSNIEATTGTVYSFLYINYVYNVFYSIESANITIRTNNSDASSYKAIICLEYTKTTD